MATFSDTSQGLVHASSSPSAHPGFSVSSFTPQAREALHCLFAPLPQPPAAPCLRGHHAALPRDLQPAAVPRLEHVRRVWLQQAARHAELVGGGVGHHDGAHLEQVVHSLVVQQRQGRPRSCLLYTSRRG